jgi:hypothetical protein
MVGMLSHTTAKQAKGARLYELMSIQPILIILRLSAEHHQVT